MTNNNRVHSHLDEIEWIGKIADLKDEHYRHSLLLSSLIELLTQKGVFTLPELAAVAQAAERRDTPAEPVLRRAELTLEELEETPPPAAAQA